MPPEQTRKRGVKNKLNSKLHCGDKRESFSVKQWRVGPQKKEVVCICFHLEETNIYI
jgi:hypothetical protein